jgi:hypothetical protein
LFPPEAASSGATTGQVRHRATNPYRRPVAGAEAAHIFAPIEGLSSASTSEVPVVVDATTSVLPETNVGGSTTGQLRQRTADPFKRSVAGSDATCIPALIGDPSDRGSSTEDGKASRMFPSIQRNHLL